MRIYHESTGREAEKRSVDILGGDEKFCLFPSGTNKLKDGLIQDAKFMDTIEEAALFLIRNPTWKIWLKGNSNADNGQLNNVIIEGKISLSSLK